MDQAGTTEDKEKEEEEEDLRYYLARECQDHMLYSLPMSEPENWKTQLSEEQYALCINWFFGQANYFRFHPHTVMIAIDIFNRYIFSIRWMANQLSVIASTAIWIASKVEEVRIPLRATELCNGKLKVADLCVMETMMLKTLDFRIPRATLLYFIAYFKEPHIKYKDLFEKRLTFILQRLLTTRNYIGFLPSVLAHAAINAAIGISGPETDLIIKLCCF
jgi:Cyclin, N-terminal domain